MNDSGLQRALSRSAKAGASSFAKATKDKSTGPTGNAKNNSSDTP